MRQRAKSQGPADRGAATVLVAVLVSTFLIGLGAIVTDTGSWYVERTQLQNGADAGALATAQSCARAACDLTIANTKYAGENNNGELSTNAKTMTGYPCGNAPTGTSPTLPPCAATPPSDCPPNQTSGNWVDVRLQTTNPVQPILGQALSSSNGAKTIVACAQATWGPAGACGACVPMTISLCEWYQDTNNGNNFASAPTTGTYSVVGTPATSPPSYLDTITARRANAAYGGSGSANFYVSNGITDPHSPPNNSTIYASESVLYSKTSSGFGSSCNTGSDNSNQTAPGQFGWLSTGPCTATIGATYGGITGAHEADCTALFTTSRDNMTPLYLPVYSNISGSGSGTTYTLAGFAAFVVTGWGGLKDFSNSTCDSLVTEQDTSLGGNAASTGCTASFTGGRGRGTDYADYCDNYVGGSGNCNGNSTQTVYGYFTKALIQASDLPGGGSGNDLGTSVVRLSG